MIFEIEKILRVEAGVRYPVCLTGDPVCFIEDCAGLWRYQEMLEVLKNLGH